MALIVFITYILILFVVGIVSGKKITDENLSYYLGNRTLKSVAIGLSAGATGNSGFIMTGAVGLGYLYGSSFIMLPLTWFLGDLIYWKYFPHKLNDISRENNIISPITYITKSKLFRIFLSIFIIGSLSAYAISQFFASSKTLNGFFEITHLQGILLTTAAILVYLIYGGFRASVITDIIQAIMMLFTTIYLLLHITICNDLSTLSNLPSSFYIPFYGWSLISIIGFVLGWSFAAIGFGLGQPQIISRYFAGESTNEVKKAKWIYILFLQITWIGMTTFGLLLKGVGFQATDPESALSLYSKVYFNEIIAGLIIAGVFSSIASTVDSMLLSISTSLKIDIFNNKIKVKNSLITFSVLLILMLLTIYYNPNNKDSIVFILSKLSISLLASSLGLALFLKIVFKSITNTSITIGVFTSIITCILWYKLNYSEIIVESLPAIIVGLLVTLLSDKWIKKKGWL